jgi:hypothetical protein
MQACQRPRPTSGTLACIRGALLQGSLNLRGVFAAASSGRPVAEGTAWLQRHLQGTLTTIVPVMTHVIAEQYRAAEPDAQQVRYLFCLNTFWKTHRQRMLLVNCMMLMSTHY